MQRSKAWRNRVPFAFFAGSWPTEQDTWQQWKCLDLSFCLRRQLQKSHVRNVFGDWYLIEGLLGHVRQNSDVDGFLKKFDFANWDAAVFGDHSRLTGLLCAMWLGVKGQTLLGCECFDCFHRFASTDLIAFGLVFYDVLWCFIKVLFPLVLSSPNLAASHLPPLAPCWGFHATMKWCENSRPATQMSTRKYLACQCPAFMRRFVFPSWERKSAHQI